MIGRFLFSSECRDFGERAAGVMLKGAKIMAPRIVDALQNGAMQNRVEGALAVLAKYSFEIAVETRGLGFEYGLPLLSGANGKFDLAIGEAFDIEPRDAALLYANTVDALRNRLNLTPCGEEPQVLASAFAALVFGSQENLRPPQDAVALFDRFFQSMTNGAVASVRGARFRKPKSMVEELLR